MGTVKDNKTKPEFGFEKLFYDYGVDLELWAHITVAKRTDLKSIV